MDVDVDVDVQTAARKLSAQRRQVPRRCATCGRSFTATTRAKYCSHACNARAAYRRGRGLPESDRAYRRWLFG